MAQEQREQLMLGFMLSKIIKLLKMEFIDINNLNCYIF